MNTTNDSFINISLNEISQSTSRIYNELPENARVFRIAFLRNITMEPVFPFVKYFCSRFGMKLEAIPSGFDEALSDAINPESFLYKKNPDLVVIVMSLDLLSEPLVKRFASLDADVVEAEIASVTGVVETLLGAVRKNSPATILIHNFTIPAYPAFGILDAQSATGQIGAIRTINDALAGVAANIGNCFILDVNTLALRAGDEAFFDTRMWHIGKIPYTNQGWKWIAAEYEKFIRALIGKNKKCLILDCDNTLWGGIVGEEGMERIKIGHTYPGSCFRDFQQAILNLYNRGVILAICSKNNEQDVMNVLDNHPDMVLRRNHFASLRINWEQKPANIANIAAELNIGLDSIVFVDDSEREISLMNEMLPAVSTIQLPRDSSCFAKIILSCGMFDALTFSQEDRKRNEMYISNIHRKKTMAAFDNIDDYLRSLEMQISIKKADDFTLPRIVQLIHRTNQFNLTTIRHNESDVARFIADADKDVVFLHYSDRFGDMGITGAAILFHGLGGSSEINSFLLSCRVLSRRVEDLLLSKCIALCRARSATTLTGKYIPSGKNEQTADFYSRHGFQLTATADDGARIFELDLRSGAAVASDLFKTVECGF